MIQTARSYRIFAAAALAVGLATQAAGQHADFVLFGEADPAMAAQTAEQKFVNPITAPYFNENTFITSDVRAWYAFHQFDNDGIANGGIGGTAQIAAVQVRLALTDRLQFVAYKDGYAWFDDSAVNDEGFNDIAAGLKYNFYRDVQDQLYMSAGIGYQIDLGDSAVLQDDEEFRFWFSVDKGFDRLHVGAVVNYLHAVGTESSFGNSDRIIWHAHFDYYLTDWFSPVVEFSGYHSVNDGTEVLNFSGADVANLGGGDDLVTMGIGGEFRIWENVALRAAYEFGLTDNAQLFGDRITVSAVYEF